MVMGDLVNAGDVVSTGADSMAVFVAETSAYLLRENTRLTLESQSAGKHGRIPGNC